MANRKGSGETGGAAGRPQSGGARLRHGLATAALALVILVFVAAIGFLILQISGKSRLYGSASGEELVSNLTDMAVAFGGSIEEGDGDWQVGDVRYKGVHYRYNPDMLTFLFLGIDKMGEVGPVEDGLDGGQSDAIFLLALEPHSKEVTVIGIPRDTMAEIDIYSRQGGYMLTEVSQIALQHAYGDGGALSCERSVEAVSRLFYGLPIHGYCAINMGAIPVLNDAVGGIDLEALETLDFGELRVKEGEPLHLEGMDAYYYLHNRDTDSAESAGRRLERQKQYLTAYAAVAMEAVKADITFPVSLYGALSRYMVTDVSLDEVSYLATQIVGFGFSPDAMRSLKGEVVMGERYEEFHVDEEALYELVLEVFYEKVG